MDPTQREAHCHFYLDLLYIELLPWCIESYQRYGTEVEYGVPWNGSVLDGAYGHGHIITPLGAGVRNTP